MKSRARDFEDQVAQFIVAKHGALYRRAFAELANEHDSGKATFRNLGRIVKSRIKQKFRLNSHGPM